MYAISTVDAKKLQEMVESMQAAFDASKVPPPKRPMVKPDATPVKLPTPDQLALQALKARLSERLKLQISGGQVGLEVDPRGLVVSIREAGTFGVGSAELSDAARSVLGEVADALADVEHPVRIEGHTDDVPIRTAKYKSNWELSTARATNVVSFFVEDRGPAAVTLLGGRLRRVPSARREQHRRQSRRQPSRRHRHPERRDPDRGRTNGARRRSRPRRGSRTRGKAVGRRRGQRRSRRSRRAGCCSRRRPRGGSRPARSRA